MKTIILAIFAGSVGLSVLFRSATLNKLLGKQVGRSLKYPHTHS